MSWQDDGAPQKVLRTFWGPRDGPFVLIAALSGRALAAAARRSGYQPLVVDLFGDLDTQAIAAASERVPGTLARGWARRPLLDALSRLANGRRPAGLVYGTGFERRTALLGAIARRHGLLGNSPNVVGRMADPVAFAELCRSCDVPHPEIRHTAAPDGHWLRKRIGGAGGTHIRMARPGRAPDRGTYLQRRTDGRPVSALFVADGRESRVTGFSEQWAAPSPRRPFRYCGAVRPAALAAEAATVMTEAIARLVPAAGLVGLNSADFLVREDGFDLLEINPRPGATLDIYADADGKLFDMHVQACCGGLPERLPPYSAAAAAAVVYVPLHCTLPEGFAWPDWTADRQRPGIPVEAEGPLCTVHAEAEDADTARRLVQQRTKAVLALAGIEKC